MGEKKQTNKKHSRISQKGRGVSSLLLEKKGPKRRTRGFIEDVDGVYCEESKMK